jgi:hypothetical protein
VIKVSKRNLNEEKQGMVNQTAAKKHPLRDFPLTGTPTVAIDLDDTLVEYDGWHGYQHIGPLRPGARKALQRFKNAGWIIVLHTTRADISRIWEWIDDAVPGLIDHVNSNPASIQMRCNPGKPIADLYIDDRAWPYCGNPIPWEKLLDDLNQRGILA